MKIENNEDDFNAWLESINFVDKSGKLLEPVLNEDTTDDPDGDRE